MGYQTDYIGYLHVQPALNEAEIEFVNEIHRLHYESERGGLRAVDDRRVADGVPARGGAHEGAGTAGGVRAWLGRRCMMWCMQCTSIYLEDRQAAAREPGARERLLDAVD